MDELRDRDVQRVNFQNLSPYVRFIHRHSELNMNEDIRVPSRFIYDHELVFWISGTGIYTIEDRTYSLRPGDIHYIKPHVENSSTFPRGVPFDYFAVHFDFVYMGESLDFSPDDVYVKLDYQNMDSVPRIADLSSRPAVELNEVAIPELIHTEDRHLHHQLFLEILSSYEKKLYGYQLEMRSLLLKILCLIVRDIATWEGVDKKHSLRAEIVKAIEYFHTHYHEPIDMHRLAQSLLMSPSRFRALFKEATGKSPIEFLTAIRIDKAKEHLREDAHTITEISELIGYGDVHYFSRLFKQIEGLSPKMYRDSVFGIHP